MLRQTGPAQMPTVLFADDPEVEKGRLFASEALRGGAWIHPQHNMFLSAAHTDADIDRALQATDGAMSRRAQELRPRLDRPGQKEGRVRLAPGPAQSSTSSKSV